jgi:hypothetical protein
MARFIRRSDPGALALRDLAEARDHYHVHLANLENIVGTALGRHLIRKVDPDFERADAETAPWSTTPRTLGDSAARPWSWPCVLVFVREWAEVSGRPTR